MTIVAELRIPAAQFALGDTLVAQPAVAVEFERVVTHSQEWVMPFLWVAGEEKGLDEFHDLLARDPTVDEYHRARQFTGVDLYQIRWNEHIHHIINTIFDRKGVLIEAAGGDEFWDVVVQFDGQSSISDLQEHFESGDTAFILERIYTLDRPRQVEYSVTGDQREALVLAAERGFFDVPRDTTLAELAEELDLSPSAVSERLRRGMFTLVTNTLSVDDAIVSQDSRSTSE
jgi:predicted DNA binding protein